MKRPPVKKCSHPRVYAVACVMGRQWQHALWCTVCTGSKLIDLHMTPHYVWFDQCKHTDFSKLDGLYVELLAGPTSDHGALLAIALRDHETRRIACMRESIDREFAVHDWAQYSDDKSALIRELVERRFSHDCARLRSSVAQTIDLMTRQLTVAF